MLVKIARKIVNSMTAGLTGNDLNTAIGKLASDNGYSEADTVAIRNEYVQHVWSDKSSTRRATGSVEKLTGPAPKGEKTKKVAKPAKKVAHKSTDTKPFPKPEGRTAVMFELVLAGKSNATALAAILKKFPSAPTNTSSISWVRSQLRNNPKRWDGKHGVTLKLAKAVKADKDCK